MGGPEAEGGDCEVDVVAWLDGPRAGGVERDAEGVAGEGFDCCCCCVVGF